MSIEHNQGITEQTLRQEQLDISVGSLMADNRSEDALVNRVHWDRSRKQGNLIAYFRCSDARVKPVGLDAISWGSIAATSQAEYLAANRGIKASVVVVHFDGDSIAPGKIPLGCGGLSAKLESQTNNNGNKEGIHKFVDEKITHPDPFIQSWVSASRIAKASGKPVLAVAQDHLTLEMHTFASFLYIDGYKITKSAIDETDIIEGNYDPAKIYENGIPVLSEDEISPTFQEILDQNAKEVKILNERYPNLREMQKVQKPRMIMLSTDIRSARVRYPDTSSTPGSIFKLHVPREKAEGAINIPTDELENCLNQLEYPIRNAISNFGNPILPFSNTDRLIIETADIHISKQLAQKTLGKDWMKEWIRLPNRKIIVVQTKSGVVSNIEYFAPKT